MALRFPKNLLNRKTTFKFNMESAELGYGEEFTGGSSRLLDDEGSFNISRHGKFDFNFYKRIVTAPWWQFFISSIVVYLFINLLFAGLYYLGGHECIANIVVDDDLSEFEQKFYFSVQTFTTVGYGYLHPSSTYAHVVSTFNAFSGLMFFAVVTGLLMAKFSAPQHHVVFSKNVIVSPFRDGKALMFRIANTLDNYIVDLTAKVTMTWIEEIDGVYRRKFATLDLELDSIYLFPLNWTIVHKISKESPLYEKMADKLIADNTEFLIMIKGYDRVYGKEIHVNRSYGCHDLVYGAQFETMYETRDNHTLLHLDRISNFMRYSFMEEEE